ncbi:hypothetical protein IW262DRAFT_1372659 [Armillaria fumosa]|nr:hypothetical protein IW262DRAFT_1372659 [Armillaria fumosa]
MLHGDRQVQYQTGFIACYHSKQDSLNIPLREVTGNPSLREVLRRNIHYPTQLSAGQSRLGLQGSKSQENSPQTTRTSNSCTVGQRILSLKSWRLGSTHQSHILSRPVVPRQRPIYDDRESTYQYQDHSFDTYREIDLILRDSPVENSAFKMSSGLRLYFNPARKIHM